MSHHIPDGGTYLCNANSMPTQFGLSAEEFAAIAYGGTGEDATCPDLPVRSLQPSTTRNFLLRTSSGSAYLVNNLAQKSGCSTRRIEATDVVLGETRILDAGEADRWREAADLIFEYIAATEAELGHTVPAHHADPSSSLAAECDDLRSAYPPPGTVLIADRAGRAVGCVALRYRGSATAEVKRLYVRPADRGGVGRALMIRLHEYADRHRLTLLLDVLATRRHVIALYQDLGYRIIEPVHPPAIPLVFMERRT